MSRHEIRRPADVAVVPGPADDDGVELHYVAQLPSGPMVVLSGTASVIWQEALVGPEAALAERVAARLGHVVSEDEIRAEVAAFVDDLVARGLLERHRAGDVG